MKWKVFAIIESLDLLTGCDGIEEGDAADSTKKEIEACQYSIKAFATFLTVKRAEIINLRFSIKISPIFKSRWFLYAAYMVFYIFFPYLKKFLNYNMGKSPRM